MKRNTLLSTGKYAKLVPAKLVPNTCTSVHFITTKIISNRQTRVFVNISKSKTGVKLNSGLSPDFSVQLEVLSKRLSQKVKSPNAVNIISIRVNN